MRKIDKVRFLELAGKVQQAAMDCTNHALIESVNVSVNRRLQGSHAELAIYATFFCTQPLNEEFNNDGINFYQFQTVAVFKQKLSAFKRILNATTPEQVKAILKQINKL